MKRMPGEGRHEWAGASSPRSVRYYRSRPRRALDYHRGRRRGPGRHRPERRPVPLRRHGHRPRALDAPAHRRVPRIAAPPGRRPHRRAPAERGHRGGRQHGPARARRRAGRQRLVGPHHRDRARRGRRPPRRGHHRGTRHRAADRFPPSQEPVTHASQPAGSPAARIPVSVADELLREDVPLRHPETPEVGDSATHSSGRAGEVPDRVRVLVTSPLQVGESQ